MSDSAPAKIDRARTAGPSDDVLADRVKEGSSVAFRLLVGRYQDPLQRFSMAIVQDEMLAQDIAQEVLVTFWDKRSNYRSEGKLKAYLFTLARNRARSHQRKQRVRALLRPLISPPQAPASPEEQLVLSSEQREVQAALKQIDEKYRLPLVLRFSESLAYRDIAEILKLRESTARSRVYYGLRRLKSALAEEGQQDVVS